MELSKIEVSKIENYLIAIMAMAEKSNNEYTESICQLVRDCEVIIYKEEISEDGGMQ